MKANCLCPHAGTLVSVVPVIVLSSVVVVVVIVRSSVLVVVVVILEAGVKLVRALKGPSALVPAVRALAEPRPVVVLNFLNARAR